jgi:endoplasmic reticulum-Golgi intermediate compartment protein 3
MKLGSQSTIESNQYSVTEHLRHLSPGSGRGLPGLYFYYEVSPVQAIFTESRGSLTRFLTSVCAIVGGSFVMMGLIDGLLGLIMKYVSDQRNVL